ncbi:DUF3800 domain-containing protein [Agrobacterium cavarae]|uniref:DUF3800 domain-containing protein n=1 Tax=Agrobacterium cavarae TaxID=2528239 RepID=UPI003FD3DD20
MASLSRTFKRRAKASRLIQLADLIAYWIFRHYQTGDQRGYTLIIPYLARYGVGPVSGLCRHVTPETDARLASLPAPSHPLPAPTPKLVTIGQGQTTFDE